VLATGIADCASVPVPDLRTGLPAHWRHQNQAPGRPQADLHSWWKVCGDPTLNRLVDEAAAINLDIVQALERLRAARVGKVSGPSLLEDDPALRANTRTVTCVLHFDAPSSLRIGQRVLVRILRDAHVNPPSPGGTGADGGAKAD